MQEQVVVNWIKQKGEMGQSYHPSDIKKFVYNLTSIIVGKNWVLHFLKQ